MSEKLTGDFRKFMDKSFLGAWDLDEGKDTVPGIRQGIETEDVILHNHLDGWLLGGNDLHRLDEFQECHSLGSLFPLLPPRNIPQEAAECRLDSILWQLHSVSSG